MSFGRRTRLLVCLGSIVFALLALIIWLANPLAIIHEKASPDRFDLGTVVVGSDLEVSARLLTSANKHALDVLFEKFVDKMPNTWHPALWKWNPGRFRKKAPQVDLTALKPKVELPGFAHLQKIVPDQRKEWFDNRPFFVLYLKIDASQPGNYSGQVNLRLVNRKASLPIRFTVAKPSGITRRVLIVETLYSSDGTEYGADLDSATKVLSSLNAQVDCLHQLPAELGAYQTILLAEDALAELKDEEASRLQTFVRSGGRLVLAANAFYFPTVPKANQLLADYGLQIVNKDYAPTATATNIMQDAITEGIRHLEFFRPSLIRVRDPSMAKIIAPAPTLDGGFVAVARLSNGGEIIVLAQSLWWNRLNSANGRSDNARLLHNMLRPDETVKGDILSHALQK